MWVRNRVIEINRLGYVQGKNMMADIGSQKGAKIDEVLPGTEWILGKEWMSGPIDEFPVKTAVELDLTSGEVQNAQRENIVLDDNSCLFSYTDICRYVPICMPIYAICGYNLL